MGNHESPRDFWLALGTLLLLVIAGYAFILVANAFVAEQIQAIR